MKSKQYKSVNVRACRAVKAAMDESASRLTERERNIVNARFGLGDEPPATLQSIGDRWNLTRERVRQIVNGALDTLGVDPWQGEGTDGVP